MKNLLTEAIDLLDEAFNGDIAGRTVPQLPVRQGDPNAVKSISIIADCSGSMIGEKIKEAKKAMITFLGRCPADMEIGLITFGGEVKVPAGLSYEHKVLQEIIENLQISGSTPFLRGLKRSYKSHIMESKADSFVILFTDGKPTENSESKILNYGEKVKKEARIITVGIGSQVNNTFLRKLASTDQDYYFAEAPEDITDTFREVTGTLVKRA